MSHDTAAVARFSAGAVLSRSVSLMLGHIGPFFVISATIFLPYLLIVVILGGDPLDAPETAGFGLAILMLVLSMVLSSLVTAVVIHAVFQSLRSQPISLGISIGVAWERIVPIILLCLLQGLGLGLGFMVFVIPGLVLLTVWYVAMPACVVERLGPVRSLGRSLELTQGHRWPVFGIVVVLFIATIVGSMIVEGVALFLGGIVGTLLSYAWQALLSAVYAIAVTVTYYDLRVVKEGIDLDRIAEMFA